MSHRINYEMDENKLYMAADYIVTFTQTLRKFEMKTAKYAYEALEYRTKCTSKMEFSVWYNRVEEQIEAAYEGILYISGNCSDPNSWGPAWPKPVVLNPVSDNYTKYLRMELEGESARMVYRTNVVTT